MHRYEAVWLTPQGHIDDLSRSAPALPAFTDSFAAIARGALIPTDRGDVAIEDLLPGDIVRTVDNGLQTLLWRGSTMITQNSDDDGLNTLTRIAMDALGTGSPVPDLLLGPSARLYHRAPALERATGYCGAYVPARDYTDGNNIASVRPIAPVPVFHLGFAGHERITANGVQIESQTQGLRHAKSLTGDDLDLYLSLFPHKQDLAGFGRMIYPHLNLHDIDLSNVA